MNVAQLLVQRAREYGDAVAIVQQDGSRLAEVSFRGLDARSCAAAATLRARGVREGDAVLVFHPPSVDLYAALIAVFRVGAVAVFVEPSGGRGLLADACVMMPPAAFIGSVRAHALRVVSPRLRGIPVQFVTRAVPLLAEHLFGSDGPGRAGPDGEVVVPRAADDAALVTFTSGGTGQPKAAIRTHGILMAQREALNNVTAAAGERDLVTLPIVVLANLAAGATSVLPGGDLRRPADVDGAAVIAQMRAARVTRLTASPAFVDRIARQALATESPLAGLQRVVTGGGPVFPDMVARIRLAAPDAAIVSVYGSTEAEPIADVTASATSDADIGAMDAGAGLLAGTPTTSARVRVLEDCWGTPLGTLDASRLDELTLPSGVVGEIVVTGKHVVKHYLHGIGEAETKFRAAGDVWHRTGDLGRFDDRGRLWLLGRASAAMRDSRGVLYPFAAECAARRLRGVRQVAVMAVRGQRVLALSPDSGHRLPGDAEILRALEWARLDRIVRLHRIPMDRRHNSKVDYAALAAVLAREQPSGTPTGGTHDALYDSPTHTAAIGKHQGDAS